MIKKFFAAIGLMLTLALFSFLLILGGEEKPPAAPSPAPQQAGGFVSSQDLSLLASHLGVSVPHLSALGTGRVEDIPFGAGYAHLLTWTDENNLTVQCIVPAAAAALLRADALSPTGEYCVIDGMTAVVCAGTQGAALHFGNELAAYCLQGNIAANELTQAARQLQFTP